MEQKYITDRIESIVGSFRRFFSKPQFENFGIYINGIINTEANRRVVNIASEGGVMKDQSQINRFITSPKWDVDKVTEFYNVKFVNDVIDQSEKQVFFIIDETVKEVSKEGKIEGVSKHFDHSENRFVFGHKFLTSAVTNGNGLLVPLMPEFFLSRPKAKELGFHYKKITTMAMKKIDEIALIDTKGKDKVLLFDTFYAIRKILKRVIKSAMHFVTRIKPNKKIIYNGEEIHARDLNRRLKLTNTATMGKTTYRFSEPAKVEWKGFGKINVIRVYDENQEKTAYLITDMDIDAETIIRYYRTRWEIETMHKNLKQNFGFADYMVRKLGAMKAHILLSSITYAILSIIRYEVVGKFSNIEAKIYEKIKKRFTLGGILKRIRHNITCFIEFVGNEVRFINLKNAKH